MLHTSRIEAFLLRGSRMNGELEKSVLGMVIQIVSRWALMKCPLLHGNIQKETDRETEKVCYDFMRFHDSCSTE